MIGVYRIKNIKNNKSYIGVSVDIEKRIKQHLKVSETSQGEVFYIHRALKKYGPKSFDFSVLEICKSEDLFSREIYYIEKYDTYRNGYNLTKGGEGFNSLDNPKSKLSFNEIVEVRKAYRDQSYVNSRDLKNSLFPDLDMNIRNFSRIFRGESYPEVMPEVFTPQLEKYYKDNETSSYSNPGSKHGMAIATETEVLEIRVLYNFLKQPELISLFGHSKGAVSHWLGGTRYKHIPIFHKQKFLWELPAGWTKEDLSEQFLKTILKYKKEVKPCLNRKNVERNFKVKTFDDLIKTFKNNIKIEEED